MKTHVMLGPLAVGLLLAFQALAAPVNINTADATILAESLNGVGRQTAENIVTYREQNGGFESPEDLMKVIGIGPKIFEDNKEDILVAD